MVNFLLSVRKTLEASQNFADIVVHLNIQHVN